MIIGVDIDNIIYNTTQAVLDIHFENTGERLQLEDIKSYYIEKFVSPKYRPDFHKIFLDKRVWQRVELLSYCVETIRKLHDAEHQIYFVTAADPENIAKKARFLQRTFPFIDMRKHFISTYRKQMIKLDMLIDDYQGKIIGADYKAIMFDYPWNRNIDEDKYLNMFRVRGWQDVFETVEFLERYIEWERRNKVERHKELNHY